MSDSPPLHTPRAAESPHRLRLVALAAVILGVLLLAAAAFVLSYSGIHHIALAAGVTPTLARLYPVIFDAMLVIAGAAALTLRGAGWLMRCYVWLSLLILLAAVAGGDAVQAMDLVLPRQPSRAAVAVTPWVLLLLAFGLWLAMLRQLRRHRSAALPSTGTASAAAVTWAGRAAGGSGPGTGIQALLEPRTGQPPDVDGPQGQPTPPEAADDGLQDGSYIVHEAYPAPTPAAHHAGAAGTYPAAGTEGDQEADDTGAGEPADTGRPAGQEGEVRAGGSAVGADDEPGTHAARDAPEDAPGQEPPPPAGQVPAAPAFDRMHSTPTPPHPSPPTD